MKRFNYLESLESSRHLYHWGNECNYGHFVQGTSINSMVVTKMTLVIDHYLTGRSNSCSAFSSLAQLHTYFPSFIQPHNMTVCLLLRTPWTWGALGIFENGHPTGGEGACTGHRSLSWVIEV